jgi:hypothetical protein
MLEEKRTYGAGVRVVDQGSRGARRLPYGALPRMASARQPTTNAGHAAATRSSFQPGSSDQAAGVNTARGAVAGGTGTAGGGGATVWQPASTTQNTAARAARVKQR